MKKKQLKKKLVKKEKLLFLIGGSPAQCIQDAQEVGINPIRACCPGCNQN
jgi:hypothetical protein